MALDCGPEQGSVAGSAGLVHIRACVEKHLSHTDVPTAGSVDQGGFPLSVNSVYVTAACDKEFHHSAVS
jgi:hypothetical protein